MSKPNRIRKTREGAGLSLAQAAKLLGWAHGPLYAFETGAAQPTDEDMRVMAALYHCSVAWLRGETGEMSAENQALLRTVEHTGDRAVVREFMEMLSTRDPGEPPALQASERAAPAAERTRQALLHGVTVAKEARAAGVEPSFPVDAAVSAAKKRRYVARQGQTRDHHCHWPNCTAQVPPAMWGCKAHWFKLPKQLRDRIWATYAPGQEVDMSPSAEYLQVADDAQRWIREHGDQP
jgi:transcriptional regulator with XRE-family HTH domain